RKKCGKIILYFTPNVPNSQCVTFIFTEVYFVCKSESCSCIHMAAVKGDLY
ncbi:hypothetical protein L9F63_025633, partial [Diploptera punctata]